MNRKAVKPVAGLCAAALALLMSVAAIAADDVIARIGTTDVKLDELRTYIASLPPQDQAALAKDPSLLNQSVRTLLARRIVLQEAAGKKWEQTPAVMAQLERAREAVIVETYLQSLSEAPKDYPADADVQNTYDANKTAFLVPRQFQLAQIYVSIPKGADKAATDKAEKKLADIQAKLKQKGADFAAVARGDSDAPESAAKGGEIGWVLETQIRPEVRQAVAGLAKGAIADPIRFDDGWQIIRLIDTKASYTRPLTEVRSQIVEKLRADRALANRRAYLARLLEQNPPAINELLLSKVLDGVNPDSRRAAAPPAPPTAPATR